VTAGQARLTAVCVVHELSPGPKESGRTAIDKRPVAGNVDVGPLGLAGDTQCDAQHHGGAEQALYVYADEDAAWWAGHLQREIPPGLFGENLRTAGLDVCGAEIGERWRIGGSGDGSGGVLVQVTAPRIPCITFGQRMAEPHWVKRFADRRLPGAYLAVLEPGTLGSGDPVTVEHRPGHGVTVADIVPRPSAEIAQRLLDADGGPGTGGSALTAKMRRWCRTQVDQARAERAPGR